MAAAANAAKAIAKAQTKKTLTGGAGLRRQSVIAAAAGGASRDASPARGGGDALSKGGLKAAAMTARAAAMMQREQRVRERELAAMAKKKAELEAKWTAELCGAVHGSLELFFGARDAEQPLEEVAPSVTNSAALIWHLLN